MKITRPLTILLLGLFTGPVTIGLLLARDRKRASDRIIFLILPILVTFVVTTIFVSVVYLGQMYWYVLSLIQTRGPDILLLGYTDWPQSLVGLLNLYPDLLLANIPACVIGYYLQRSYVGRVITSMQSRLIVTILLSIVGLVIWVVVALPLVELISQIYEGPF